MADRLVAEAAEAEAGTTRWGRVATYLVSVFAGSWGLGFLFDGLAATVGGRRGLLPPLGMFVPALVAVLLRLFVYRDSPIHHRRYRDAPARVFHGFLLLFLVQIGAAAMALVPEIPGWIVRGTATWSMILWTLYFIRLYRKTGEERFAGAGLQLGRVSFGFVLALAVILFLAVQAALDLLFGTGESILGRIPGLQVPVPEGSEPIILLVVLALTIVASPLGNLPLLMGEEYGWRGFLQDELSAIGRRKAAALIGVVWGVWHIPIILQGIHTYPPTARGFFLALSFFGLWGIVQSYAVLKTGSIWTAAVLHGIVNGLYGFIRTYVFCPDDKIFSFGLGLYGVMCLAPVAVVILRDPIWDRGLATLRPHPQGAGVPEHAEETNGGRK